MVEAIIFDCFGVLTKDTWREFLDTLPSAEAVSNSLELNHQFDSGKMELSEFIGQLSTITGGDKVLLTKIFTDPEASKNILLLDYIRSLKPKYKIGLLSNVNRNWIREEFLSQEEQELFDDFTLSYEVGTTKPNATIYQAALAKLSVKAQETVFIDDQPRYCEAAQDLGMQAIWYQNFTQMKAELEKILGRAGTNH